MVVSRIDSGRLIVTDSRLGGNTAGSAGGAIAGLEFSAVTLRASLLTGNFAGGGGGGLAVLQVVSDRIICCSLNDLDITTFLHRIQWET